MLRGRAAFVLRPGRSTVTVCPDADRTSQVMAMHFISYSRTDGLDFALWLHDRLVGDPQSFDVWLDKSDVHEGLMRNC